jgi:hypothetical protein
MDGTAAASERPVPAFAETVAPLLARYCLDCHSGAKARGDVVLDGLFSDSEGKDLGAWKRVAQALRSGAMPPAGKPRPTPAERDACNAWLDATVFRATCATPARVTLRRLNRTHYNRTVRDLTGLDLRPADEFPADDVGYGFDNVGDVLSVPPVLAERYLAAAERVVNQVFQDPAARRRLLEPPAEDFVPYGARGLLPVRDQPRKALRLSKADGPANPNDAERDLDRAGLVLRVFADRAYRRPVRYDELTRLLRFVEESQKAGEGAEPGLKLALQAVLASPHFLFLVEREDSPVGPSPTRALNDWELAARLSYFLWGSMPDETLFRLAASGTLHQPRTLRAQVRRLLADPRSRSLAEDFAAQWLGTRGLQRVAPDPARFPDFDEPLRRALRTETELFFDAVMREDRSVREFLDADWTYLNERLARHYGIAGVTGEEFRRVSLAGTPRGGLVTQASVLAVSSNPTRTSPVKRGRWVLENLLGDTVPTPPPGADNLKPGAAPEGSTLRQRLERHRTDPACAGCHARLDPLGFGLENFDAVGAWRTHDGDTRIDASGALPDGNSFDGPAGLRAYLRSRGDDFDRCLAEKLLIYAMGRGLTPADRCAIDRIVRQLARGGHRFAALAEAVVTSEPFLKRAANREGP